MRLIHCVWKSGGEGRMLVLASCLHTSLIRLCWVLWWLSYGVSKGKADVVGKGCLMATNLLLPFLLTSRSSEFQVVTKPVFALQRFMYVFIQNISVPHFQSSTWGSLQLWILASCPLQLPTWQFPVLQEQQRRVILGCSGRRRQRSFASLMKIISISSNFVWGPTPYILSTAGPFSDWRKA